MHYARFMRMIMETQHYTLCHSSACNAGQRLDSYDFKAFFLEYLALSSFVRRFLRRVGGYPFGDNMTLQRFRVVAFQFNNHEEFCQAFTSTICASRICTDEASAEVQ